MNEKCLIRTSKGCLIKDETAIVLAVSTLTAVVLFAAGSSLSASLVDKIIKEK